MMQFQTRLPLRLRTSRAWALGVCATDCDPVSTARTRASRVAPKAQRLARRGGFTLIEMLAVLLIIGILFTFLLGSVLRSGEAVKANATRTFLETLSAGLNEYEAAKGDYPRSSFPNDLDPKPSKSNMGIEMLVISLWPANGSFAAAPVREERLTNSDGDRTSTSLTSYTSGDCFELRDDWDNPIAYIHRRDYNKTFQYTAFDLEAGDFVDQPVKAMVSSVTGDPFNKTTFQLLSAGEDGVFGTSDDVGNFKVNE